MATRRGPAARRAGYVLAAIVDAVVLVLLLGSPGWEAVPVLTADTTLVLGWVTASLLAGAVVNLLRVVADPPWSVALGDVLTGAVGVVATLRVWQVFPFDLPAGWETIARVALVVALVGGVIGTVAALVRLVAAAGGRTVPRAAGRGT